MFPTIPDSGFRPYSRLSDDFPTIYMFPIDFPTNFPTRSLIPSRPVPPRNRVVRSRPVNQVASHLPVSFPSRGKQTKTFSHTVSRYTLFFPPPAAGNTFTYKGTVRTPGNCGARHRLIQASLLRTAVVDTYFLALPYIRCPSTTVFYDNMIYTI